MNATQAPLPKLHYPVTETDMSRSQQFMLEQKQTAQLLAAAKTIRTFVGLMLVLQIFVVLGVVVALKMAMTN